MESGFSSHRADFFPAGLRVLVVDDDLPWLRILEKMLKKCSYEVTTCTLAREALDLLRERKDRFDIVISDVHMPDMDGFKLLEHVGLEMDLPVIMMSVDGETSRVMRGVQHGACDYLLKPIRMKELRNIWQHVLRKRIHEVRDIESLEGSEEIQMMRHGSGQADDGYSLSGGDLTSGKKRKDIENKNDDKEFGDLSSLKKARVVWNVDLHQKFVKAVNQIGFDKVGPKKVLDLMNVPWLTRENVASHLQKYRLYLSRLQIENEIKASFGGIKQPDLSSKDPAGSLHLQNSINMQQIDAASDIYGVSGNKTSVQIVQPKIHEGNLKSIISSQTTTVPNQSETCDIANPPKANSSSIHPFGQLEPDVKYAPFDSTIPPYFSLSRLPEVQFKQEHKAPFQLENDFNHFSPFDLQHHVQAACVQSAPSVSPRPLNEERERLSRTEIYPSHANSRSQNLFPFQSESHTNGFCTTEPLLSNTLSMKNHSLNQISIYDLESARKGLVLRRSSGFASSDEDLLSCLLQGDSYTNKLGFENKEYINSNHTELFAETPAYSYDAQTFDYEYPWESMEYPVIDQTINLFIV